MSISSGVVIGMDPFDVFQASVRRPNDERWWWWCFGFNVALHD